MMKQKEKQFLAFATARKTGIDLEEQKKREKQREKERKKAEKQSSKVRERYV